MSMKPWSPLVSQCSRAFSAAALLTWGGLAAAAAAAAESNVSQTCTDSSSYTKFWRCSSSQPSLLLLKLRFADLGGLAAAAAAAISVNTTSVLLHAASQTLS
jgi:hypothetical protein